MAGGTLSSKLIIEGIPSSFTNQDLKNLFTPFGSVISASIVRNAEGQSLRMGHVEMSRPQEAEKAKMKLHRSYLGGMMLLVFRQ